MNLILPDKYKSQPISQRVQNKLCDFLYARIKRKKTNREIQAELRKKSLPPMDNGELSAIREYFKQAEAQQPERMALFRKRLGVG